MELIALSVVIHLVLCSLFSLFWRGWLAYLQHKRLSYAQQVLRYSQTIRLAKQLNAEFAFAVPEGAELNAAQTSGCYRFHRDCSSKKEYDRFDYAEYARSLIAEDLPFFEKIQAAIEQNRANSTKYQRRFADLYRRPTKQQASQAGVPKYAFQRIEQRLYQSLRQTPIESITLQISIAYTSPQGRKSHSSSHSFAFEELQTLIDQVQQSIKHKNSAAYQRALMTDSLRYDMLKRDKFTCRLCGANKADGVKLHIDHIHPVSKGGQSIPENLQTLCERCNLGKSDKV